MPPSHFPDCRFDGQYRCKFLGQQDGSVKEVSLASIAPKIETVAEVYFTNTLIRKLMLEGFKASHASNPNMMEHLRTGFCDACRMAIHESGVMHIRKAE